jgi:hypothetical protein
MGISRLFPGTSPILRASPSSVVVLSELAGRPSNPAFIQKIRQLLEPPSNGDGGASLREASGP